MQNRIREEDGKKLDISGRVYFRSSVSNEQMPYLYRQPLALVMPRYLGPTNLPPLEAFRLAGPVLYPDKPGLLDQVQGAALLMDLHEPATMAEQLSKLYA